MFDTLPKPLQQEVLHHLKNDDFREAKRIYDAYFKKQNKKKKTNKH